MNLTLLFWIAFMILGVCFLLLGIFQKFDFNLKESWQAKQYSVILGLVYIVVGIIIILVSMT